MENGQDGMTTARTDETAGLGLRPLYVQVREKLLRRLVDGVWAPGDILPSEMQLAAELGVSQGTVRKALDAMAAENLVVRKQGRGTFVARHDDERIMFQFFRLKPDAGERKFPDSTILSTGTFPASAEERGVLGLDPGARVIRIERLRSIGGLPAIVETVILPAGIFGALQGMELPNNLYGLFAVNFGVVIMRSTERLKAVAASAQEAKLLSLAPGAPVLQISRIAYSLENQPVEWRISTCTSEGFHYSVDLR